MPNEEKKDFATTGTESFKLPGQGEKKDKIVLTIEDEKTSEGVFLDKINLKKHKGENVFIDILAKINDYLIRHANVKLKDKATFFHLLSVMIDAGIPLVKSLKSLVSQMNSTPKLQMVIEQIAGDVESGESFSESLLNNPDVFNEQEVGMIQSGEASGQLSGVLENLADDTEKAYSIKAKVKSAMMYPTIVFLLLIAVVVIMMVVIVPQLKSLFESNQTELPLITRIVVAISDFMVEKKITFVVSVLGVILFFLIFRKTDIGRYLIDKFKISVPIFGPLFKKAYLSRFSRSLSNLLDSNISIVKAIEITGNSIGNDVYKRRLLLSMEDVKQGIPLSESLTESDLFPPILVNMIEVGEQTAQLDKISAKVAKFYEEEVDTAVAGISKIIEPVILGVIGITVGAVVAAIMLPIMKLSEMAGVL